MITNPTHIKIPRTKGNHPRSPLETINMITPPNVASPPIQTRGDRGSVAWEGSAGVFGFPLGMNGSKIDPRLQPARARIGIRNRIRIVRYSGNASQNPGLDFVPE